MLQRLGGFRYEQHDFGPGTPTPEGITLRPRRPAHLAELTLLYPGSVVIQWYG